MQKMGRFIYISFWLVITVVNLKGEEGLACKLVTDWNNGALILHVSYPVLQLPKNSMYPKARSDAEKIVGDELPFLAREAMKNIIIDSSHTFDDYYQADPGKRQQLDRYFLTASLVNAAFTPDLKAVGLDYTFAFYGEQGLCALFVEHELPCPLNRRLGYTDDMAFTGIVIYARGEYAIHGKQGKAKLEPALYPCIYDEAMNLVLAREMCDPVVLKKWGFIAVTDKTDLTPYQNRIGSFPYRVMMRKVYGRYNTDIVISVADAVQLLASPENRELLRQGKILIIYEQIA